MTSGVNQTVAGRTAFPRGRASFPGGRAGLAATLFFVVFAAVLLSGRLGRTRADAVSDLTFVALGLIYVPLAVRTARAAHGRLKAAWTAMTIGFVCWLVGEILWAYYGLVAEEVPFPSWSDAAYLAYYPWVCCALLLFPTARSWRSQAQVILDATIVTGSFFLISSLTVMRSVWNSGSESKLEFFVSVAYPAGDVLVMTIGLLVLIRAAPGLRRTLSLLVAGLMAAALADSLWIYESNTSGYAVGPHLDILYAANSLLIILALLAGYKARPGSPGTAPLPGWLSRSMPLVPLAVAAIFVGMAQPGVVTEGPVIASGLLVIVSLVLRQMLEAAELAKREQQVRSMADQLAGELASASRYVASTLPGDLDGPVRVRSRYLPSRAIGGDSFGYLWIDDDHLIVYMVDVSGFGVQPAMLSVSVHNVLRSRSMPIATLLSPEQVMVELNRLFRTETNNEQYFTLWYGVYEASTRMLRYAVAGHPPALVLNGGQRGAADAKSLGGTAMPIGMFPDSEFSADSYQVSPGDQVLLWSDGVLGDRLSFAGFMELCQDVACAPNWTPASLIGRLRASAGGTFDDDCALVQLTF